MSGNSYFLIYISVHFSCSVVFNSLPGFPVHHQLPEFTQLMSIKSAMPSNHFILCNPLLLLPSILPNIRVFSHESVLWIRWPVYWNFSFSISPSNEYSGLISLQSKGLSRLFSGTTVQKHQFFGTPLSLWFSSHIVHDCRKNHSFD